jgi:hypothetical protein
LDLIVVRFPDGAREFRFPERPLQDGDTLWHEGERYRVVHVGVDAMDRPTVTVEADSGDVTDMLRSEEGSATLVPVD